MLSAVNALTGDRSTTILYILIGIAVIGIFSLTIFPKLFKNENANNHTLDNDDANKD